jgi:(R,R)-butanediol dehydrogenase/meso-butanediol dehydrogenase/diacetyl reductase
MNIFPLPDSIPLRVGALVEPLSVAWHAVRASGIRRAGGQNAVILGAGPIGLALLLTLKAWGVQTVIVSEILEARRELARGFGADYVINPQDKDGERYQDSLAEEQTLHLKQPVFRSPSTRR